MEGSRKRFSKESSWQSGSSICGVNHVLYCDNFYSSRPLVDSLARDRILFVGTIKKNAKGFPAVLKSAKPPKGSYLLETVEGKSYFVFHDHREVCFVTNVFPERMDAPVARLQPEGVLRYQSVPLLLPAYNKFMGGVDRTDQLRKTYVFDRKSKHYWLRLFFQYLTMLLTMLICCTNMAALFVIFVPRIFWALGWSCCRCC